MKKTIATFFSVFILGGVLLLQSPSYQPDALDIAIGKSTAGRDINGGIDLNYGRIPLYFIKNNGQNQNPALFYARTSGYSLGLTRQGLVFGQKLRGKGLGSSQQNIFSFNFLGATSDPEVMPVDKAEYRVNYFFGQDQAQWRTNVPTSKAVLYKELYPAIDLKVYGRENKIEYDWIIHSGGDVSQIRVNFIGAQDTWIDSKENLTIKTDLGEFKHLKPMCYQMIAGARIPVAGSYQELAPNTYGIDVVDYDKDYELVIDPVVLVYSTYLGTKDYDEVSAVAVDPAGAAYITGSMSGVTFSPTDATADNYLVTDTGMYITKIYPAGTELVYSTFIGGSAYEVSNDLTVDSSGSVYVVGFSRSADYPVVNPFQAKNKGSEDVFITKLSPDGSSLVYSSFLGGTSQEWGKGIAIDKKGAAYVAGSTVSADFPIKKAFQKTYQGAKEYYPWDGFITKIHPKGNRLVYSSFLGGNGQDLAYGVAVNSKGEAFITGGTSSTNFPRKKAVQKSFGGRTDAFVCKVHRSGNRLLYSTFLGGDSYDSGNGIAVDAKGAAYVVGETSSYDFPVKSAAQGVLIKDYDESENDVFVTKLSPTGRKIVYSTFLGGGQYDRGNDIAVDNLGAAYIIGFTASKNFPIKDPFQASRKGEADAFISKLHPNGRSLLFSTFLGGSKYDSGYGIALEGAGKIYAVGVTDSKDFPLKKAIQKKKLGKKETSDVFITKMELK